MFRNLYTDSQELIKPNFGRTSDRRLLVNSSQKDKLDVGGAEGDKYIAELFIKEKKVGKFVYKEYDYQSYILLKAISSSYSFLRRIGFIVPNTVRISKDSKSNKIYLVMSDMKVGNKYWLWGPSDNMTRSQYRELKKMELTLESVVQIEKLLSTIINLANEHGVVLQYYYLHLRKNKMTQDFEICLLDVDPGIKTYEPDWQIKKQNDSTKRRFLSYLYSDIDEN